MRQRQSSAVSAARRTRECDSACDAELNRVVALPRNTSVRSCLGVRRSNRVVQATGARWTCRISQRGHRYSRRARSRTQRECERNGYCRHRHCHPFAICTDFGRNAQYGSLLPSTYLACGGGGATVNRINNFRNIISNPCRA